MKQLPDISSNKSKAASATNPHVVQKCKAVSMKKNLKLPQNQQQMLRVDAEINAEKKAAAPTVVPTVVSREATNTQDVTAIHVEPTTMTGVQ